MSKAASRESAINAARQRTACLAVAWGVHKTLERLEEALADDKAALRVLADVRQRHTDVVRELRIDSWADISSGARREMDASPRAGST